VNRTFESPTAEAPPRPGVAGLAELWAWTLSLALLGSWTCFAALPGINWTLWTLAATLGFAALRRPFTAGHATGSSRAPLALACVLSGAAAITADPRADALIFLTVGGLCYFALLALVPIPEGVGPVALLRLALTLGGRIAGETGARIEETLALWRLRRAAPILRGGCMAAGLAGTLFLLLSPADPILADWRDAAWSSMRTLRFLTHDLFFLVLALVLLGAYGLAARIAPAEARSLGSQQRPRPPTTVPQPSGSPSALPALADAPGGDPTVRFSEIERLMVLGAALALFVLFFALELSAQSALSSLLITKLLPRGETFAEATHRGFGEMLVAAVLCASVIIALDHHSVRGRHERSVLLLSWAVIAASLLLVASAYLRVRFYESAYGFTEERIYVQVCCGAVLASLMLLAWQLRRDALRASAIDLLGLTLRVALVGIACVAALAYWNTASWIVSSNLQRYQETGKIDVDYLAHLARSSPDAVPTLVRALARLPSADAGPLRDALRASNLDASMLVPSGDHELAWYEWSLRRAAASSALRAVGLTPSLFERPRSAHQWHESAHETARSSRRPDWTRGFHRFRFAWNATARAPRR
jgi:Domain of unknown function (DUF4153)